MKIVFMGTPDFAAVILQALLDSEHEICGVATQPDKAKDRGKDTAYPCQEVAISHGIPGAAAGARARQCSFLQTLADWQPDLCVVAAYGQIFAKEVLELPKLDLYQCSCLAAAETARCFADQQAIVSGETETGVTIMQMAEGWTPEICWRRSACRLTQHERRRAARCAGRGGCKAFGRNPARLCSRRHHTGPQDDSQASYAGMIRKQDRHIDFYQNTGRN